MTTSIGDTENITAHPANEFEETDLDTDLEDPTEFDDPEELEDDDLLDDELAEDDDY